MTLSERLSKFLQTDKLVCANDGEPLKWGYLKMSIWPQYPILSVKWFRQFFGNTRVARFHDYRCFAEFASKGKLAE